MAIGLGAAIIGSAIASSLFGTGMNHIQRATDRNFNASEAQKQRNWEEYMSSTAYSRAVDDMKNAGLNPALMYGGGTASSTPGGSSAHVSSPTNRVDSFANLMNSFANVAHVFNFDSSKQNNISFDKFASVSKDLFTDLSKIKF